MADSTIGNVDVDPTGLYIYYNVPQLPLSSTEVNISGDVITNVTTINGGGGGRATGPSVTFQGSDGADFVASQTTITWVISNPTTMRTALSAAKSGVNTDITQLNGASQVDVSGEYKVSGTQVVTARQPAIPDAIIGTEVATINLILAAMRVHGLIAP